MTSFVDVCSGSYLEWNPDYRTWVPERDGQSLPVWKVWSGEPVKGMTVDAHCMDWAEIDGSRIGVIFLPGRIYWPRNDVHFCWRWVNDEGKQCTYLNPDGFAWVIMPSRIVSRTASTASVNAEFDRDGEGWVEEQ